MNTLDDLRTTLEQHAEGFDDTARPARVAAVHHRVRAVRRRRASAGVVAATLAVVAGVAAVGSLREPGSVEPAGPSVVGVDVPDRVSVHGFPYDLIDSGAVPEGEAWFVRGPQAVPQSVSLVGRGLGSGSATLYADDEAVSRVFGDGVGAPVPVAGDVALTVRYDGAPGDSRTGLAFYEATGEPAPGVADGAIVFREQVGSATLVDAAFSTGPSVVELPAAGDLADLHVATWCTTDERGMWLTTEVDGQPSSSRPCVWDGVRDPGTNTEVPAVGSDGRSHTVRTVLTRGSFGPDATDTKARLGLGIYAQETTMVAGTGVPSVVEAQGRTWALDPAGMTTVEVDNWERTVDTTDGDVLLGVVGRAETLRLDWEGRLSRGSSPSYESDLGAAGIGALLLQGDRYTVRMTGSEVRKASLLVYRPV